MQPTHGYCQTCREESALDSSGACLWCGAATTRQRAKGTYKRRSDALLSDNHVRALHRLHFDGGYSARELGKRIWREAGYASWSSAAVAITRSFRRLHLPVRYSDGPSPASAVRRCVEDGCGSFRLEGEECCWHHHPDNREQVQRNVAVALAAKQEALV